MREHEIPFQRGSYETAYVCLEKQKQFKTFRGEQIAKVVKDVGCNYRVGEFVIVSNLTEKTCTIEKPLTPQEIDSDNRRTGSLITTIGTTICFPRSAVEIIEPKASVT